MSRNKVGIIGERAAKLHLINLKYDILETNWRCGRAEIDIIAMLNDVLVFVEVKTRKTNLYGQPESFVSERKKVLYRDAASIYMEEIGHNWEIRFDIISVIFDGTVRELIHYKDSFF